MEEEGFRVIKLSYICNLFSTWHHLHNLDHEMAKTIVRHSNFLSPSLPLSKAIFSMAIDSRFNHNFGFLQYDLAIVQLYMIEKDLVGCWGPVGRKCWRFFLDFLRPRDGQAHGSCIQRCYKEGKVGPSTLCVEKHNSTQN